MLQLCTILHKIMEMITNLVWQGRNSTKCTEWPKFPQKRVTLATKERRGSGAAVVSEKSKIMPELLNDFFHIF